MNNQQNHISLKIGLALSERGETSVHVQVLDFYWSISLQSLDTLGQRSHVCGSNYTGVVFTFRQSLRDTAAAYKLWLHQRYLRHADSCNSTSRSAFHTASSDTNWMEGCNQSTGWRAAINQGCSTGKLGGGLITWLLALHSWVGGGGTLMGTGWWLGNKVSW